MPPLSSKSKVTPTCLLLIDSVAVNVQLPTHQEQPRVSAETNPCVQEAPIRVIPKVTDATRACVHVGWTWADGTPHGCYSASIKMKVIIHSLVPWGKTIQK